MFKHILHYIMTYCNVLMYNITFPDFSLIYPKISMIFRYISAFFNYGLHLILGINGGKTLKYM